MQRLFADLVLSRPGGTARRAGFALPTSLVLHAAGLTLLVLVSLITRETLPPVETPPGPIRPFVRLPPEGEPGPPARAPRPRRPAPPSVMAFVPELPPVPTPDDVLDALEGPPDSVVHLPCLQGCQPGVGLGGVPGGDPNALTGSGAPTAPTSPIRPGGDIRPPLLQTAAADAVRQWLYRPTLLNGVAVPVVMTVTVRFTLGPSGR